MKILHVTEALGGGVTHLISQLAKLQALDGWEVILAHSIRPETASQDVLDQLFPPPIRRIVVPMVTPISLRHDLSCLLQLMKIFRQVRPDVIHLHSSKAGVLGRIAASLSGYQDRGFYSPHGLSFLREDVSPLKRRLFLGFEQISALLGGTFLASCGSEASLARETVGHRRVVLVENSIDTKQVRSTVGSRPNRVRVITSGFIRYPKAPWRFRDLAVQLKDEPANFAWIGDGELRQELLVDGKLPPNLVVSGWQDRERVLDQLSVSHIFILLSLWEGMPLALIEAQAAGLPAVVSNAVGCRDVVRDGVTGFVCASMEDAVEKVRLLIRDRDLRNKMGENARVMALERFSVERMHREVLAVYGY